MDNTVSLLVLSFGMLPVGLMRMQSALAGYLLHIGEAALVLERFSPVAAASSHIASQVCS